LWNALPQQRNAKMNALDFDRSLLESDSASISRQPRSSVSADIKPVYGPIIATGCDKIYNTCSNSLCHSKVPKNALVNASWLGNVPHELQGLSFTENMLIARICHNCCVVKVSKSGMYKMQFCSLHLCQKYITHFLLEQMSWMRSLLSFILAQTSQL
jgi:predicted CxxxxCH...CXXCH cytochrome family protein